MNSDISLRVRAPAGSPTDIFAAKKRRIVRMLLAYSAIVGFFICFFLDDASSKLGSLVSFPLVILAFVWCLTDAAERGHQIGFLMKWLIFLNLFVGFPIYVFQTRGVDGFKTLGWALLLAVAMMACTMATMFMTLFVGGAMGYWEFAF